MSLSSATCNIRDCPKQVKGLKLEADDRLARCKPCKQRFRAARKLRRQHLGMPQLLRPLSHCYFSPKRATCHRCCEGSKGTSGYSEPVSANRARPTSRVHQFRACRSAMGAAHSSPGTSFRKSGGECSTGTAFSFDDALNMLYRWYGRDTNNIGTAVREYKYWSGPVTNKGFDDEAFSSFAYEKVIWPILDFNRRHQGLHI